MPPNPNQSPSPYPSIHLSIYIFIYLSIKTSFILGAGLKLAIILSPSWWVTQIRAMTSKSLAIGHHGKGYANDVERKDMQDGKRAHTPHHLDLGYGYPTDRNW